MVLLQVHAVPFSALVRQTTCISWMSNVSFLLLYVGSFYDICVDYVCLLCCVRIVHVIQIDAACLCCMFLQAVPEVRILLSALFR